MLVREVWQRVRGVRPAPHRPDLAIQASRRKAIYAPRAVVVTRFPVYAGGQRPPIVERLPDTYLDRQDRAIREALLLRAAVVAEAEGRHARQRAGERRMR